VLTDVQIAELIEAEEEEPIMKFISKKADLSCKTSFISNVCNYYEKLGAFSTKGKHLDKVKSIP
jgi:hypothetical protein